MQNRQLTQDTTNPCVCRSALALMADVKDEVVMCEVIDIIGRYLWILIPYENYIEVFLLTGSNGWEQWCFATVSAVLTEESVWTINHACPSVFSALNMNFHVRRH